MKKGKVEQMGRAERSHQKQVDQVFLLHHFCQLLFQMFSMVVCSTWNVRIWETDFERRWSGDAPNEHLGNRLDISRWQKPLRSILWYSNIALKHPLFVGHICWLKKQQNFECAVLVAVVIYNRSFSYRKSRMASHPWNTSSAISLLCSKDLRTLTPSKRFVRCWCSGGCVSKGKRKHPEKMQCQCQFLLKFWSSYIKEKKHIFAHFHPVLYNHRPTVLSCFFVFFYDTIYYKTRA